MGTGRAPAALAPGGTAEGPQPGRRPREVREGQRELGARARRRARNPQRHQLHMGSIHPVLGGWVHLAWGGVSSCHGWVHHPCSTALCCPPSAAGAVRCSSLLRAAVVFASAPTRSCCRWFKFPPWVASAELSLLRAVLSASTLTIFYFYCHR